MKNFFIILSCMALIFAFSGPAMAKGNNANSDCTTIQDGTLYATDGTLITTGFDELGYNYQAHQYIGFYGNYQRPPEPVDWGYRLMMKWSDEWLSNKDCNGDGKLDRGYTCDPVNANNSGCPGAWLTNHQSGEYENEDGETCEFNYFVKIVAAPADAELVDGIWYTADGDLIGEVIWGAFAIIQEVENDPCAGLHGAQFISPVGPGFGKFK